ncbi:MAG TPA: hypothetical protein VIK54_04840 [Acidimicrobiia bacterium]
MIDPKPKPDGRDPREVTRLVAGLVLLALLIAFVIDNTRFVTVGFVFFDHRTRLIYVLIVTAVVGVVLDRLWQRHRRH